MKKPLGDVRILAIEQFGAGPWCTLQLADLGADVIKIEDPTVGGDVGRYVPPYQSDGSSLYFETFNRNKRSVSLDLRHPLGRTVFEDLVHGVDVVFSNLRGDQPARLGLLYRDLRHLNPSLVCCSLSGFGMSGPRSGEGGYDHTVQGLAGWQSVTGEPHGPPVKSGLSLVDFSAGYMASTAILAALWRARREGSGGDVDLSLFETALAELTYLGTWVASRDYQPVRRPQSAHQSLVPFQNFETADGWIVIACPKATLWTKLCHTLGCPDLATDGRFATFADRDRNRDQLLGILSAQFQLRPTGDWLKTLAPAGIPCAPVLDVAGALADEQALARGDLLEYDHPTLGTVRQVASPFRLSDFEPPVSRGPFLGEHTFDVLGQLCGYDAAAIRELARQGLFGSIALGGEAEADPGSD